MRARIVSEFSAQVIEHAIRNARFFASEFEGHADNAFSKILFRTYELSLQRVESPVAFRDMKSPLRAEFFDEGVFDVVVFLNLFNGEQVFNVM